MSALNQADMCEHLDGISDLKPAIKGRLQFTNRNDSTINTLEKNIAALENAQHGLAFSSGLAACCAITKILNPGDHILIAADLYGGSYYLIENVLAQYKISVSYVDICDPKKVEKAIAENTKLLWVESLSNPLLRVADLSALTTLAKNHNMVTVVDNTLATPYSQKPLDFGADIVLHHSYRYLSGSRDIVGAALVSNRADLFAQLQNARAILGDCPDPFDCFCILKGIRALSTHMLQQEKNAKKLAAFLDTHGAVKAVHYPGLPGHPQHELATKQMHGFGNVLSFELKDGAEAAIELVRSVRVFTAQEKLAGNTIYEPDYNATYASTIIHAKLPERVAGKNNYTGSATLVRLTVGTEDADILIDDLAAALPEANSHLVEFPTKRTDKLSMQA